MNEVYNILKEIQPHFFSLREVEGNVSLDLKIPTKWKFEGMMKLDGKIPFAVKVQDKKTTNTLISLISTPTSEGYDLVFKYADVVIDTNKEEEEKERLFKEKVNELKSLFLNSPLDKLKDISFKDDETITIPNSPSSREIGLGNEEGSGDNREDETKTDSGDSVPG